LRKQIPFFAGLAALAVAGCGGGDSGSGVLAVVNGVNIPMSEYYGTMERKRLVVATVNPATLKVNASTGRVIVQDTAVSLKPSMAFQTLQECIANEIIRQVAMDEGVYPKPEEIDAEIKLEEEREPAFVKRMSEEGLTIDQIKRELAMRLVRYKLQAKGAKVSEDEVIEFIKSNKALSTQPAKAEVMYIQVPDEKTKALVDKELKEGNMFATVAGRYTINKAAKDTGFKTVLYPDTFPPALRDVINQTPEDRSTTWLKLPGASAWTKLYILRKEAAKPRQINNYMKVMTKRQLEVMKGSKANEPEKRIADKLKASKIEIKVKYLQEPWKQAFAELTKAKADTQPGGQPQPAGQ